MIINVSCLSNILRKKDTNIAISNGNPQKMGNHIAANTKNAVNQAKKEEYTIYKDPKLVNIFVKKMCPGLRKIDNTCKPFDKKAFKVLKILLNKQKMKCDVFFV